jgi:tyrosyl-tRNA synthetase
MTSSLSPLPSGLSPLPSPLSPIIEELSWRGLINQSTDEENLPKILNEKPRAVYAGFDPTADSLHVGHLMALMILRRFQKAGHKPIALIGGATGMIGDPSGKSEERKLLSLDVLAENIRGMEAQMRKFLNFDSGLNSAVLVNNFDWMSKFGYLDFLRDIGKHFPVNVMLTKDSVKLRLERTDSGLSYTEFSYMLLQAYDFVHLYDDFGCELQIGGSDQWGNITAGIDLCRRLRGAQLYGMTIPLLTKSDGAKMGKTESGALWLSAEKTSPYQFYQYWINLPDADVGKCLRFFTDLNRDQVQELLTEHQADPGRRAAQRRLAAEITRLVHGDDGLATAERATEIFFGAEISDLSDAQLTAIFADVPSKELPRDRLTSDPGLPIADALVESGLAKSKGEARRIITQGGAYVNNRRIESVDTVLTPNHLAGQSVMVLRSGKKNYALLRFV